MAVIGAIANVAGGIVGAIGQKKAGDAQASATIAQAAANKELAYAQARADEYNMSISQKNAGYALTERKAVLDQSDSEALDQVRTNRARMSTIRASYGAAGIDLEGSPLDAIMATAIENEMDVKRIKYAGRVQAAGKAVEAEQHLDEAQLYKIMAEDARRAGDLGQASATSVAAAQRTAGRIGAISSLFGGFSAAATSFARA